MTDKIKIVIHPEYSSVNKIFVNEKLFIKFFNKYFKLGKNSMLHDIYDIYELCETADLLKFLNDNKFLYDNVHTPITKGMLISLIEDGYRNEYVYVYDGIKVVDLDCNDDPYGVIPQYIVDSLRNDDNVFINYIKCITDIDLIIIDNVKYASCYIGEYGSNTVDKFFKHINNN